MPIRWKASSRLHRASADCDLAEGFERRPPASRTTRGRGSSVGSRFGSESVGASIDSIGRERKRDGISIIEIIHSTRLGFTESSTGGLSALSGSS